MHGDKAGPVWLKRLGIAALVLGLVVALAIMVRGMMSETKTKRTPVQQVLIMRPPPPPPPPKTEPKPPEPPPKQEEVKIDQAKPEDAPKDDAKPQESKPLGLDAEGGAGADGFGLAANKGGRDITTLGSSGGGSKFGWYAGLIQAHLQSEIARNKKLRGQEFRAVVHVWLKPDGSVERAEVVGSTGKGETDQLLKLAFAEIAALKEPPPSDLPQPVKLRISNRF